MFVQFTAPPVVSMFRKSKTKKSVYPVHEMTSVCCPVHKMTSVCCPVHRPPAVSLFRKSEMTSVCSVHKMTSVYPVHRPPAVSAGRAEQRVLPPPDHLRGERGGPDEHEGGAEAGAGLLPGGAVPPGWRRLRLRRLLRRYRYSAWHH